MPNRGLEVVTGSTTAPGATLTALVAAAGNSFQVRNVPFGSKVQLLGLWAQNNAAGVFRVRSPRLHDNVQGIRGRVTTADTFPLYPLFTAQPLIPQDVLIAELSGSAVGGQIEQASLLIYYDNLPGIAGRFTDPATVKTKAVNVFTAEVAVTPGVAGGYSGQLAINSQIDLFKANTDYALLGYQVTVQCCTVRIQGVDFGNLGVGGPGAVTLRDRTAYWFWDLSEFYSEALIPVFNAANKQGILVDVVQNQAGAATVVTLFCAELPPGIVPGAVIGTV